MAEDSSYQTTRRTPISDIATKTNSMDNMYATSVKSCRNIKAIPQGTGTFSRQSQHICFI